MKHTFIYTIGLFILIFSTNCQANFSDLSNQQKSILITPMEKGDYHFPIWVSNDLIIFEYELPPDVAHSNLVTSELRTYNLKKGVWENIPVMQDTSCPQLSLAFLQRLSNQSIIFLRTCTNSGDEISSIQTMDIAMGQVKTLPHSGSAGRFGEFAFSPDLSEFVQEHNVGLSSELFYHKNDTSTQILPDFIRAMRPSWSPHDRVIAFWGTENYKDGKPTEFTTSQEMDGLLSYPWDLYISTPEGSNTNKILSSVKEPFFIQWSPTEEKTLVFGGTIGNVPGVWLVDTATSAITRIWAKGANYVDWSPDGSKLVISDYEIDKDGSFTNQSIHIIYLK